MIDFKDKKVLMIGLGLLGGGIATANWLLKQGARLTIFDLKSEAELQSSLEKIKGEYSFVSGKPIESDINECEIVVVNPAVSFHQPIIKYAQSQKKQIENEATIFYRELGMIPKIAITGTRGKTTVVNWTAHFLKNKFDVQACGNSPEHPLLGELMSDKRHDLYVIELPSFALEFFDEQTLAPDVAVITNISSDHLNRYDSIREYVDIKSRIFWSQSSDQHLILNFDSDWTSVFTDLKPKAHIWYIGREILPAQLNGLYAHEGDLYFQKDTKQEKLFNISSFVTQWGIHNLDNLMASALSAHLKGVEWSTIEPLISTLPNARFRQEVIYHDGHLTVINDTTATSPDGSIAAIRRFTAPSSFFIFGGTDAQLDYAEWGRIVAEYLKPEQMVFLSGSATEKMLSSLPWSREQILTEDDLSGCVNAYRQFESSHPHATIIFSPGAKSFEKFKNEFDRGEQFNNIVKEILGG